MNLQANVSIDCFGAVYCNDCAWEGMQYGDEYLDGDPAESHECKFCAKKWDPLFLVWE